MRPSTSVAPAPTLGVMTLRERRARARDAAEPFDGVLSRVMLSELGFDAHAVAREARAQRWRMQGRRSVAVHTGSLSPCALRARAVWETGCGAALDGASALQAAGMTGFDQPYVDVSVSHDCRPALSDGVRLHRVVRAPDEVVGTGLARIRPEIAAVRAARWATSDRQAALLLALPVQQRLVTGGRLVAAAAAVGGRRRRALIPLLAADIADGAHSLGELDFGRLCRRHGLPPPDRQVVRQSRTGRIYLDARWAGIGLTVEIDGAGHRRGLAVMDDSFRQNSVSLAGDLVLRFDLLALRLRPADVMAQVTAAFVLRRPDAWGAVGAG